MKEARRQISELVDLTQMGLNEGYENVLKLRFYGQEQDESSNDFEKEDIGNYYYVLRIVKAKDRNDETIVKLSEHYDHDIRNDDENGEFLYFEDVAVVEIEIIGLYEETRFQLLSNKFATMVSGIYPREIHLTNRDYLDEISQGTLEIDRKIRVGEMAQTLADRWNQDAIKEAFNVKIACFLQFFRSNHHNKCMECVKIMNMDIVKMFVIQKKLSFTGNF